MPEGVVSTTTASSATSASSGSRLTHANPVEGPIDWASAIWPWPYLGVMTLIS